MIAHYQAINGDPAAAMAVADSIPSLKRGDFPGLNEGFYDSVKPVTYVKIAQCELKAGRRDVAAQTLDKAMKLCEAIVTPGERTVAEIMILDALMACGRDEDARVLLKQAVPRALSLTEPRRSRSLAVLVASQAKLGDFDDARKTIDAIRDYPGLEKMRGLHHLADAYEKRGDEARMKAALREELAAAGTKKPEEYGKGPMITINAFSATTYIDPDADFNPGMAEHFRQMSLAHIHARLGDLDGAKKSIEAQPAPNRPGATNALVSSLVSMGKVDQALELVRTMDSFENRLSAMQMLACMIRDRDRETLKAR